MRSLLLLGLAIAFLAGYAHATQLLWNLGYKTSTGVISFCDRNNVVYGTMGPQRGRPSAFFTLSKVSDTYAVGSIWGTNTVNSPAFLFGNLTINMTAGISAIKGDRDFFNFPQSPFTGTLNYNDTTDLDCMYSSNNLTMDGVWATTSGSYVSTTDNATICVSNGYMLSSTHFTYNGSRYGNLNDTVPVSFRAIGRYNDTTYRSYGAELYYLAADGTLYHWFYNYNGVYGGMTIRTRVNVATIQGTQCVAPATTMAGVWADTSAPDTYGGDLNICVNFATLAVTGTYSNIGRVVGTLSANGQAVDGYWIEPLQGGIFNFHLTSPNDFFGSWNYSDFSSGGMWSGYRKTQGSPPLDSYICTDTYAAANGFTRESIFGSSMIIGYIGGPGDSPLTYTGTWGVYPFLGTITGESYDGGYSTQGTWTMPTASGLLSGEFDWVMNQSDFSMYGNITGYPGVTKWSASRNLIFGPYNSVTPTLAQYTGAVTTPTSSISLEAAIGAIQTGLNYAQVNHPTINFAIVITDIAGRMKAFVRMDGAALGAVDVAQGKAQAAYLFDRDNTYWQDSQQFGTNSVYDRLSQVTDGGIISIQGGTPLINSAGVIVGYGGCSGSFNPLDDQSVVYAVAEAVSAGVTASTLNVPSTSGTPYQDITLSDAANRVHLAIQSSIASGVASSVAIVDSRAILKAFMSMDGALPVTTDVAMRKARTSALLQINTADFMPSIQPGSSLYTIDNSNGQLTGVSGGRVLTDTNDVLVGGIGVSATSASLVPLPAGQSRTSLNAENTASLAAGAASVPSHAPVITLSAALSIAQGALSASAGKQDITVAVVDNGGNVIVLLRGDGCSPAGVDLAIKKARGAVYFGAPGSLMSQFISPGVVAYSLQYAFGGSVFVQGSQPLINAVTKQIEGAVGVYGNGSLAQLDQFAQAGVANYMAHTLTTLPQLTIPARNSNQYNPADATLNDFVQAAKGVMTAATASGKPSAISGVDGSGALKLLIRMDGAVPGAVDISKQLSRSAFAFPHTPQSSLQALVHPGSAGYTEELSPMGAPYVFGPGGMSVSNSLGHVVGSLGVSGGVGGSDASCAMAGVTAFGAAYTIDHPVPVVATGLTGLEIALIVIIVVIAVLLILFIIACLRARSATTSRTLDSGSINYNQM